MCLAFSENQCAGLCRSEERLEGIYTDCIKDPYNAGACVRACVCLCTHGWMVSGNPLSPWQRPLLLTVCVLCVPCCAGKKGKLPWWGSSGWAGTAKP